MKTTHRGGPRGYDGGKKVGGRKRFVMVAALGRTWALMARPADVPDRVGGRWRVEMIRGTWATLREVIVDSGFGAKFVDRVSTRCRVHAV